MITLFTFNKKAWRMNPLQAVKTFGTPDASGRLGLYFTMSFTPNKAGLFLEVGANTVAVKHSSGLVIAEWQLEDLERQFTKKLPALVLVGARSKVRDGVEWFHYTKAQLLTEPSEKTIRGSVLSR